MDKAHFILSLSEHLHELPHEPLSGRFENIRPMLIKNINNSSNIVEINIVNIIS